jgi:hypothetical protein
MAKKVLRYTEKEFITLLENIVKRVKKEEMISESREKRKKILNDRFKTID